MNARVAIVGGGLSGLAAAYQLTCDGVPWTLFEASARLGGIVETVYPDGFVIECGPDSWVTEKPWARELAVELGLGEQLIPSNDATRRTWVQRGAGRLTELVPIPDGMRMMVPSRWGPLLESPLFSWQARLAYLREPKRAEELKAAAPADDEPVASFVRRHFGDEVATSIAGPLLSAVFGGDITQLSVRAVMPAFVRMEAEHGSLIQAISLRGAQPQEAIFTTLAGGLQTLIDTMVRRLPGDALRTRQPVLALAQANGGWRVSTAAGDECFGAVVVATPAHVTGVLLEPLQSLLPSVASSAVIVAQAFAPQQAARMRMPRGFGYVVPPDPRQPEQLLACTFVHQKFARRAPEGAVLVRAFFGGASGEAMLGEDEDVVVERARRQMARTLGPLPAAVATVVRRWPRSLPQYTVGHLQRMAGLKELVTARPGLYLVGSGYFGVGLPDVIRDGRGAARSVAKYFAPEI